MRVVTSLVQRQRNRGREQIKDLPNVEGSSTAALGVKQGSEPSQSLIPKDPPFKPPIKAQSRERNSANSIKTTNKIIPTEPPQLPGEARHLQFHFALVLCLLHLPEKSVGKLARVSTGGGTGPRRRD